MTKREQFFQLVHEATEFCVVRAGRCFAGWSREKIFVHIAANALEGTMFIVKNGNEVKAIGFAKPTGQNRLFIGQVVGGRAQCRELFRRVMERWPDVKRFFAYRDDHLTEFDLKTMRRFCG